MNILNYHHLRYFREVAIEGHLGRTAEKLNVSQSALSIQIKQLEDRAGHRFFDRVGRGLVLTEAGKIALDHANRIFGEGDALMATLNQHAAHRGSLRIGALSTLSRNFQLQFLRPLLQAKDCDVTLKSGNTRTLLADLADLALDVVLTTELPGAAGRDFAAQRIAEQPVGLHGAPDLLNWPNLPALLQNAPLIVPNDTTIRTGFTHLVSQLGVTPHIVADVDDMAMVRLLTREGVGVAVAPQVVLADEIAAGLVASAPFDLEIVEPFFAVTLPRQFPHPALQRLLQTKNGTLVNDP